MRLNRTKNAKRNIIFGSINKIVNLLFPFLIRMVIIRKLGAEYLGLGSLFSSILQVLNLTELGFSSAVVYSMYKPVADDDKGTLCAILGFYRKVYLFIGLGILGVGITVLPFLSYFIKGEYPSSINIYVLYCIYLIASSISYLLFAYKDALFTAYQRVDVISNINTVVHIVSYTLQLVLIIVTKNYYLYACVLIVAGLVQNFCTQILSKKQFPDLVCYGSLDSTIKTEIKIKVKGLLVNKLCQTSRNSFDSIFVSVFLGLTATAMYNNYYYIMNAVIALIGVIAPSILGGIGNSVVIESQQKNYEDMRRINFLYMWIAGGCTVCLFCLYQPFTELAFGKEMLFPLGVVFLFCVYFYVLKMGDIRTVYSDAKGLWYENRWRAISESVANIILNLVFGRIWGIYGIVLATIVSLFFINFLWGSTIIYKYYFTEMSVLKFYLWHLLFAGVTVANCIVTYFLCSRILIGGILGLMLRLVVCICVVNVFYLCMYCRLSLFKETLTWGKLIFFRKRNLQ